MKERIPIVYQKIRWVEIIRWVEMEKGLYTVEITDIRKHDFGGAFAAEPSGSTDKSPKGGVGDAKQ